MILLKKKYLKIKEKLKEKEGNFSPVLLPKEIYFVVRSSKEKVVLRPSGKLHGFSNSSYVDKRRYKRFSEKFIQHAINHDQIELLGSFKELFVVLEERFSQFEIKDISIVDAIDIVDQEEALLEIWDRNYLIEKLFNSN